MGLLAGDEHASRFREDLEFGSENEDEGKDEDGEETQSEVAQAVRGDAEMKVPLTLEDKKAMALLIVLCAFAVFTAIYRCLILLIFRMDALFVRRYLHLLDIIQGVPVSPSALCIREERALGGMITF